MTIRVDFYNESHYLAQALKTGNVMIIKDDGEMKITIN